jgi:hypothetical protein
MPVSTSENHTATTDALGLAVVLTWQAEASSEIQNA